MFPSYVPANPTQQQVDIELAVLGVSIEENFQNRFANRNALVADDPTFVPKEHTALGRFRHEGATVVVAWDGRVVVYSGDDERFDYMCKYVGTGAFDPDRRKANFDLLGAATLYVAKFNDDGTGEWRPLVFGQEPLTRANGTFFAGADPSLVSPISSSDNITFDGEGNLWIATDGQPSTLRKYDGIYAVPVDESERGSLCQFLSGPVGGELSGPEFAFNFTTPFCAIQHPGEGGRLERPASTWPDGTAPPRPSVIAEVKTNGGPIGG